MKTIGGTRTPEIDAIPEPFLPNQLDVGLAFFVELFSVLHLPRLFIAGTQQVSNSHRTLDVLDKYPLVMSNKSVYLVLPVFIVDTRECKYKFREYRETMGRDALDRERI